MNLFVAILSALILLISFMYLIQNRINSMISAFVCQSFFLVIITFIKATELAETSLYISAILNLILKVIFIPYLLKYFIKRLNIKHKAAATKHPFILLIFASIIVLFCYHLVSSIAIATSVMLLGMLLLITHKKAISHVIGFMSIENGIFLAALTTTHGMPMIVELGIAFDVIIAAILFGIFFLQLRNSIDSLDVDQMNLLREDKDNE